MGSSQSTGGAKRKAEHANPADPRSPTTFIPRTPIRPDDTALSSFFDPRSPSMNVRRTPIERTNPAIGVSDVPFAHAVRGAIDIVPPALSGFDPRSPTVGLARTPIAASNAPAGFDPRSPTVGLVRTPIGNGYHAAPVGWDPRSPTLNIARTPIAGGQAPLGFDPRSPTVNLTRTPVPKALAEIPIPAKMTGGAAIRAKIEEAAATEAPQPAVDCDDTPDTGGDYELLVIGVGINNTEAEPAVIEADLTELAMVPATPEVEEDGQDGTAEPENTVDAEIQSIVANAGQGMANGVAAPYIEDSSEMFREISASMLSDLAENIENSVHAKVQKVFSPTNHQRRRESQEAVRRKSAQKVATESPKRRAFGVLTNSPNSTRQNSKTSMFTSPSSHMNRMNSLQNIPLPGSPKVLDLSQGQGLRRSSVS